MVKKRLLWLLVWVLLAPAVQARTDSSAGVIEKAYRQHRSNLQVTGEGTVIKLLPDDNQGDRHQRFILRLPSGFTVLVAHNIDLATKVAGLKFGDRIEFAGEYEWSEKGGTVHWTHRDPARRHADGWLRFGGKVYQ